MVSLKGSVFLVDRTFSLFSSSPVHVRNFPTKPGPLGMVDLTLEASLLSALPPSSPCEILNWDVTVSCS